MEINKFLDKFDDGFTVFKGGIGDLLFNLSEVYSIQKNLNINIIGWADNAKSINNFLKPFKQYGIKQSIIFEGNQNVDQFLNITKNKNFKYKCHVPDYLNYSWWIHDYQKYKKNIPEYWNEIYDWFKPINKLNKNVIGIGVFGSRKESHKIKHLNTEEFNNLLKKIIEENNYDEIKIFGTINDKNDFPINVQSDKIIDLRGKFDNEFENVFKELNSCNNFISSDTWYKTWTNFINNIKTIVIKNRYIGNVKDIFGVSDDPGNNIFLKDFRFNVLDVQEILNSRINNLFK